MKVVGIVAEYNPFHKGHLYHLTQAKALSGADYSVAIVSSSFVQRGEPGIFSKWQRAEMAVLNGIDLVIELPVFFSCRSSYYFALGSVLSLIKSNIISHLAFGIENDDLKTLNKIALFLLDETEEFKKFLSEYLKKGFSFPASREMALKQIFPEITLDLNKPNVILALDYLRVLNQYKSKIEPVGVKRIGGYHSLNPCNDIAGATLIRNLIESNSEDYKKYLTPKSLDYIASIKENGFSPCFIKNYNSEILYKLRSLSKSDFLKFMDSSEDLTNRLFNSLKKGNTLSDIIKSLKSKSYTETRINRFILNILLNYYNSDINQSPSYLRVLSFNEKGRSLIKLMKDKSEFPIITKFADFYKAADANSKLLLDYEIKATNIYSLKQKSPDYIKYNQDFLTSPIYVRQ